jgi:hypothetical protein
MRWLAPVALVAAIGVSAAMASPRSVERSRTVPCSESIGVPRFPYVGSNHADGRYRLVLGAVSVPPAYLAQTSPTQTRPWRYFSKSGLVVRAALRQPVLVTVPRAWRNRAAIAWGYGGHGVFSSLSIRGCPGVSGYGFAYAGGFYLRSRSACIPLMFSIGQRSAVLLFGVGGRCG